MASIVDVLGTGDKCLKLTREQYFRRMAWGDSWEGIRCCMRYAFEAPDSLNKTGSYFVGVCSGMKEWNHPDCAIMGWFAGNISGAGFPGLSTFNWNGGYYSGSTNGSRFITKVGSVITLSAGNPSLGWLNDQVPTTHNYSAVIERNPDGNIYSSWAGDFTAIDARNYSSGDFLLHLDMQAGYGVEYAGTYINNSWPADRPADCFMVANFSAVPLCIFDIGVQKYL